MESHVYKSTPQRELSLDVFTPTGDADAPRPAVVFFHGGGWNNGAPGQFYGQARHLAERGMIGISAQYRLKNEDDATPIDAAADALSAVRWVRAHAEQLGLDPERLGAGGGSAGGQLAAVTATLDQAVVDQLAGDEDTTASPRPDALLLFNPVYDNSPEGFGSKRFDDRWETFSPLHNLHDGMPPTFVVLGDSDELIPVATAEAFRDRMRELGVRSELTVYEGQPHGFFNKRDTGMFDQTVQAMDDFLTSLGWLEPK